MHIPGPRAQKETAGSADVSVVLALGDKQTRPPTELTPCNHIDQGRPLDLNLASYGTHK